MAGKTESHRTKLAFPDATRAIIAALDTHTINPSITATAKALRDTGNRG
jgi:hypothetical protein